MHQVVEGRECEGVVFPDQRGEGFLLLHLPLPLARLVVALPTLVVAEGVLRWIHLAGITSPLSGAESVLAPGHPGLLAASHSQISPRTARSGVVGGPGADRRADAAHLREWDLRVG